MKKKSSKPREKWDAAAEDFNVDELLSIPTKDILEDLPSYTDIVPTTIQLDAFQSYLKLREPDFPFELGCVVRLDRGFPLVQTVHGAKRAEHSHTLAKGKHLLPVVGDWVILASPDGHDMSRIDMVLPRSTAFERWRGGKRGERQTLAANVDTIFIVQALSSGELNANRLARSLVLVNDCGARPIILLTKADRKHSSADLEKDVDIVHDVCGSAVQVIVTSSFKIEGIEQVKSSIKKGVVSMILGESGAGKSTLLNNLLGHEVADTQAVRLKDDKGRHTTVARVMYKIPGGGVLIDAPGLRSLPLVGHEKGLARTFPEIIQASYNCKFRDCTHTCEPGCQVLSECKAGNISQERLDVFLSLAKEMRVSAQSLDPDIVP